MASRCALVSVLLVLHFSAVVAVTTPFDSDEAGLGCENNRANGVSVGCTCSVQGLMQKESALTTECDGANPSCKSTCCGPTTPKTCGTEYNTNPALCGATKTFDMSKVTTESGTTAATTCCKDKTTATCANVVCTSPSSGVINGEYKKKTGVADSLACTSRSDCKDKCCEKAKICKNADSQGIQMTCPAATKVKKKMGTSTKSGCKTTYEATAAASATFTDQATFETACCDAKEADGTCPATPTCPTGFEKDATKTTCSGACASDGSDCCKLKATTRSCSADCTAGTDAQQGADSCGDNAKSVCTSTKCDAAQVLDKSKIYDSADDAATVKSKCCIAKEVAPTTGKRTCEAFHLDTQNAANAASKGEASESPRQHEPVMVCLLAVFAALAFPK